MRNGKKGKNSEESKAGKEGWKGDEKRYMEESGGGARVSGLWKMGERGGKDSGERKGWEEGRDGEEADGWVNEEGWGERVGRGRGEA